MGLFLHGLVRCLFSPLGASGFSRLTSAAAAASPFLAPPWAAACSVGVFRSSSGRYAYSHEGVSEWFGMDSRDSVSPCRIRASEASSEEWRVRSGE